MSDHEAPGRPQSFDDVALPMRMQATVTYGPLPKRPEDLLDLPDDPWMIRLPVIIPVMVPRELLYPDLTRNQDARFPAPSKTSVPPAGPIPDFVPTRQVHPGAPRGCHDRDSARCCVPLTTQQLDAVGIGEALRSLRQKRSERKPTSTDGRTVPAVGPADVVEISDFLFNAFVSAQSKTPTTTGYRALDVARQPAKPTAIDRALSQPRRAGAGKTSTSAPAPASTSVVPPASGSATTLDVSAQADADKIKASHSAVPLFGIRTATSGADDGMKGNGQSIDKKELPIPKEAAKKQSDLVEQFSEAGSKLQEDGLIFIAGGVVTTGIFPEAALAGETAISFGEGLYAMGSAMKDAASITNLVTNNGDGSGYLLGKINDRLLKKVPEGPMHDLAATLLDKAEEASGLEKGDEGDEK